MITEIDENDREWVRACRKVNGKTVYMRIPLEQYEREQEAIRVAEKKRAAEERAEKERRAAEAEQQRRAAIMAAIPPLDAMLIAARRGLKGILPKLRKLLSESPDLWQHFGNLSLQSQQNWINLIAGRDLYLAESLRLNLDMLRADLAGPHPSALERLVVDRVLAAHLQTAYFDAYEAQRPGGQNAKLDQYLLKRQDQAQRQFLHAAKTLATIRQLAARTQTIEVRLINPPMVHSPVAPIITKANGEEPIAKAQTMQPEKSSVNGSAWPINRINGVNGHHSRFTDLLEPATAQ